MPFLARSGRRYEKMPCAAVSTFALIWTCLSYLKGAKPMNELLDLLRNYRAGQASAETVRGAFEDAGWDGSDISLLIQNVAYAPLGSTTGADLAEQFLRQQERQRRR